MPGSRKAQLGAGAAGGSQTTTATIKATAAGTEGVTVNRFVDAEGNGPLIEPKKMIMISAGFIGGVTILHLGTTIFHKIFTKSE